MFLPGIDNLLFINYVIWLFVHKFLILIEVLGFFLVIIRVFISFIKCSIRFLLRKRRVHLYWGRVNIVGVILLGGSIHRNIRLQRGYLRFPWSGVVKFGQVLIFTGHAISSGFGFRYPRIH